MSEIPTPRERFYVIAISGYTIGYKRVKYGTSYSVLDSAQGHREVFSRYHGAHAPWGKPRDPWRLRGEAKREAARLNALDRKAMLS